MVNAECRYGGRENQQQIQSCDVMIMRRQKPKGGWLCFAPMMDLKEGKERKKVAKTLQEGVVVACRGIPNWESVPMSKSGLCEGPQVYLFLESATADGTKELDCTCTPSTRPEQGRGGEKKRQKRVQGEKGGRAILASGSLGLHVHIIMWSLFKVHLGSNQSDRLVPEPE